MEAGILRVGDVVGGAWDLAFSSSFRAKGLERCCVRVGTEM